MTFSERRPASTSAANDLLFVADASAAGANFVRIRTRTDHDNHVRALDRTLHELRQALAGSDVPLIEQDFRATTLDPSCKSGNPVAVRLHLRAAFPRVGDEDRRLAVFEGRHGSE